VLLVDTSAAYIHLGALRRFSRGAHQHIGTAQQDVTYQLKQIKTGNRISNTNSQNNALLLITIALAFDQPLDGTYHRRWHVLSSPLWCCCCEIPHQF
jgi:hypothetical protein